MARKRKEVVFLITHERKYDVGEKVRITELRLPEYRGKEVFGEFAIPINFGENIHSTNGHTFPLFVHELLVDSKHIIEDKEDSNVGYITKAPIVRKVTTWTNAAFYGQSEPRVETKPRY